MSIDYIINMGLGLSAFILIISLLILIISAGDLKKRVNFFFFLTTLLIFSGMLAELFVELMIGQASPAINIAIRVLDCFSYSIVGLQLITFSFYFYEYLSTKAIISKKPFYLMAGIGVANVILALIASFTHLYVVFDAHNNYIQQETFWISDILPTLMFLISFGVTIYYIRLLKKREWVSLLLCSILPILFYVLEVFLLDMYLAIVGVCFLQFLIYVNLQVELKHQLSAQEMELTEARIAVMLSQIQPHFLYNTLNTIKALIKTNPDKAQELVGDFSIYLRRNIDSLNQRHLVAFQSELEHIKLYLNIEKQRFMNRLNVIYDLQTTDFMLPVLTVQPLVENAVRHGITKKREGGTVTVSTRKLPGAIQIMVADDGIGFNPDVLPEDGRSHIGLDNVRKRLGAQCGGILIIETKPESGTTATITIPQEV